MVKVKLYQRCPFRVAYKTKDGLWHNYVPDILVTYTDSTQEVIEVKPQSMLDFGTNPAKFEAAKRFCKQKNINFVVWTEDKLGLEA